MIQTRLPALSDARTFGNAALSAVSGPTSVVAGTVARPFAKSLKSYQSLAVWRGQVSPKATNALSLIAGHLV
jgi:hypothetical protein